MTSKAGVSFLFIFLALSSVLYLNSKIQSRRTVDLNYAPPPEAKYFLFGYNEPFADSLWIRILQNPEQCEMHLAPEGGPRTGVGHVADCNKGWVYHMLDATTEIAPRFKAPAQYGPLFLSVLVDDIEGATLYFEKVLKLYPNDWELNYQAATHYMREVGDLKRAAELYSAAAQNGAPKWIYALSANLYKKTGQALAGKILLENFLKNAPEDFYGRDRVQLRLKEIDEELARAKESGDL
jgi:tetratricopeptide (TPR) repeat protein